MKTLWTLVVLVVAGTPTWADVVVLRGGGQVRGTIVGETADEVTVEAGPGQIGIKRDRIAEIRRGASALDRYRERAAQLASDDLDGWLALARWTRDQNLATQSREAYERCLAIDPSNAEARVALGFVLQDGRWMSEVDAYRARGFVEYEGEWMPPQERDARLEERRVELERQQIEAEAAVAEAQVKAQEAEARAREAEARAREAAARADEAAAGDGTVWWVAPAVVTRGPGGRARHHEKGREREKGADSTVRGDHDRGRGQGARDDSGHPDSRPEPPVTQGNGKAAHVSRGVPRN